MWFPAWNEFDLTALKYHVSGTPFTPTDTKVYNRHTLFTRDHCKECVFSTLTYTTPGETHDIQCHGFQSTVRCLGTVTAIYIYLNSQIVITSNPSNLIWQAIRTYSGTRATRYWRTARTSATSARVTCSNWWLPRCSQRMEASINVWPPTPLGLPQAVSLYLSMVSLSSWLIRLTRKPRYQLIMYVNWQWVLTDYVISALSGQSLNAWLLDCDLRLWKRLVPGLLTFGTCIIMF